MVIIFLDSYIYLISHKYLHKIEGSYRDFIVEHSFLKQSTLKIVQHSFLKQSTIKIVEHTF